MSSPANALAAFRSYSYYHVLLMCDSTDTADLFRNSTDLDIWDHPTASSSERIADLPDLGIYSPKCIGDKGKYIVLINGSTDAAYTITNAKWTTVTAGHAAPGDKGNSIAVEGSISISEPKGIAFLDQIVQCSIALGVDSSQVVYVLKTFFVGHLDEGGALQPGYDIPINHITDIDPITVIVYDVTGTFTEAGGTYEMNFVAVAHGAARMPQYSKAVNSISFSTGVSLQETMNTLQNKVNESYDRYYDCVVEQIKGIQSPNTDRIVQSLRRVKYVIELDKAYADPRYKVVDQPNQFKDKNGCSESAHVHFQGGTSIETAINAIMQMSPQVKEDMTLGLGGDTKKQKFEYKIHSTLISKAVGGQSCSPSQEFEYTVFYAIRPFLSPKEIAYDDQFSQLQDDETVSKVENNDPSFNALRSNIIEFDYMYTGKNIDILEFDMKLNYGMAYLQTATLANTFKDQTEHTPNRQSVVSTSDANTSTARFGGNVQIPIFFGSQIRSPMLANSQNANNSGQTAFTLAKHASIEVAEATMKITGNDQLLQHTNRTTSATYVSEEAANQTSETPTGQTQQFRDWTLSPSFAKVRIKMPRNNDDISLFTGEGVDEKDTDLDYAKDFWFDGYYYIYGVDHEFASGEFSQTLHMVALPKKSAFQSTKEGKEAEKDINANVGKCFDNTVTCGSTSSSNAGSSPAVATSPDVHPDKDGAPTNKKDADTVNAQATGLSDVVGWDTAKPEVKQAILNAASRTGVNPVTLAQIAARESGFDATIKNPKSTATGLYQIIDGTWMGDPSKKVKGLVDDPTLNITGTTSQKLAARLDPAANALGGALYAKQSSAIIKSNNVGDLYLAHFAGPGFAKAVIAAVDSGAGNTTVKSIADSFKKSPNLFNKMKQQNSTVITSDSYTVAELRSWAARVMAGTLKSGTVAKAGQVVKKAVQVPASAPAPKQTAAQKVGAAKDCTVQDKKKDDTKPCGPNSQNTGK